MLEVMCDDDIKDNNNKKSDTATINSFIEGLADAIKDGKEVQAVEFVKKLTRIKIKLSIKKKESDREDVDGQVQHVDVDDETQRVDLIDDPVQHVDVVDEAQCDLINDQAQHVDVVDEAQCVDLINDQVQHVDVDDEAQFVDVVDGQAQCVDDNIHVQNGDQHVYVDVYEQDSIDPGPSTSRDPAIINLLPRPSNGKDRSHTIIRRSARIKARIKSVPVQIPIPDLNKNKFNIIDVDELYPDHVEDLVLVNKAITPELNDSTVSNNENTIENTEKCGNENEYQVFEHIMNIEEDDDSDYNETENGMAINDRHMNINNILTEKKYDEYQELMKLEEYEIIPNFEDFECPICFEYYPPMTGVALRDCGHTFCRQCIKTTVELSTEVQIKCPYRDDNSCEFMIRESDIKALLGPAYEKHLAKSMATAESCAGERAFHCQTPNCKGWCFYDENVHAFPCPVCDKINCINCKAIHEMQTCTEYKEAIDPNAPGRKTDQRLNEMLQNGEAMRCTTCTMIVTKVDGCDAIECAACKTKLCWATKQARWGPRGYGDTSGGCRCKVGGIMCHATCRNCH